MACSENRTANLKVMSRILKPLDHLHLSSCIVCVCVYIQLSSAKVAVYHLSKQKADISLACEKSLLLCRCSIDWSFVFTV